MISNTSSTSNNTTSGVTFTIPVALPYPYNPTWTYADQSPEQSRHTVDKEGRVVINWEVKTLEDLDKAEAYFQMMQDTIRAELKRVRRLLKKEHMF